MPCENPSLSFSGYKSSSFTFATPLVYFAFWRRSDPWEAEGEGSKRGPICGPILEYFLAPTWSPKWFQKLSIKCHFGVFIFISFFWRCWSSFGASWEPSWAFPGCLGRPWTPKIFKNLQFVWGFLLMQVFGTLRLLMGLLGPSWPLLGRSGPKWVPKMAPKVV